MIGVHAYWSQPTLTGTQGHHLKGVQEYSMFDFEIVHFILSALYYRKLNGPIHLYTDPTFYNYLKSKNLLLFWDKVDTDKYSKFEKYNIDAKTNWTGFKTWLLGELPAPFLLLDHDNIIYTEIPKNMFDTPVRFAHMESINPFYYPDKDRMDVGNFKYNENWDWSLDVANTCMMYFKDNEFKNEYCEKAMEFERNNCSKDEYLAEVQYLFADQRLPVLMLEEKGIEYDTFSNLKFTPLDKYTPDWTRVSNDKDKDKVGFDHTWAYKHTLIEKKDKHREYMQRHKQMILTDFRDYVKYFKQFFNDPQL